MTMGARFDWPQHLGYKTCVSKFHNSGRDVEEVNGPVRRDLAFIKVVRAFITKYINELIKINAPVTFVMKKGRITFSARVIIPSVISVTYYDQ